MPAARKPMARSAGVFVVLGVDSYLTQVQLEQLLAAHVAGDSEKVQVLRGEENTWVRVLDAARSRSLFTARRALVVRAAEALKSAGEEGLQAYLDDPNPEVALILLAAKPDRRRTLWKLLLERAEVLAAEPLKGRALRAYLVEALRRRRLALSEDGVEELLERVGQDLRRLMGEVDKLEAFAQGDTRRLGAEEVAQILGRGLARPLYKLSDALWARRAPGEIYELIDELLQEGEAAPRVLATLHRALRQVRGARSAQAGGVPREQWAARLGVLPFKVSELAESARRWPERDLGRALEALVLADRRLKTGADAGSTLLAAVVAACGREAQASRAPARSAASSRSWPAR